MGLIKRVIRLVPYATVFLLGYYLGTIDSGKHDHVFCTKPQSGLEIILQNEASRAHTPKEVIAWEPVYK